MLHFDRALPIVVQFGFGAVLCALGLWAGLRSGYLDSGLPEDRRAVLMILGGFVGLLLLFCVFNLWLPFVLPDPAP